MKRLVLVGALVGAFAVTGFAQTKDKSDGPGPYGAEDAAADRGGGHGARRDDGARLGAHSEERQGRRQGPRGRHLSGAPDAADTASPAAKGQTGSLERWVEFVKGGKVAGREVVTIIPQTEISQVQKDTPPHANSSKVETLKGGDYVRLWINKGGNHYLVHFPA